MSRAKWKGVPCTERGVEEASGKRLSEMTGLHGVTFSTMGVLRDRTERQEGCRGREKVEGRMRQWGG